MRRILATLCLAAITIALTGCSGSTTSGTAYSLSITRHVEAYLPYNHEKIYKTALDTLDHTFLYKIERSELDGRTGFIKARTAKDNVVTFSVTRETDAMSEVSVFVGPVGDQDAAQDILSRVERAMK